MKRKQPKEMLKIASYEDYKDHVGELKSHLTELNQIIKSFVEKIESGNANSILHQSGRKLDFNVSHLEKDSFKILIMGEFKRGKSTLINALLGKEILPAYTKPCTDVINEIMWGKEGKALVLKKSGKELIVSLEDLIHHVTIDGKLNQEDDKTEVAKIEWPLPLCEKGVQIIDTPGLNEHKSRTKVTNSYLPNADAIIFVLSAEQACTMTELDVIENHLFQHGYTDIFFVVNRMNNVKEKEHAEVIAYVKGKIGKFTSDETSKIHFVDSLAALDAREASKEVSDNFQFLEKSIQEHLVDKRGALRLATISNEAHYNLGYLSSHLSDRLEKVNQDLSLSIQDLEEQLVLLSQSEKLKEKIRSIWEEGAIKIQEKLQALFNLETNSTSFEVLMRRQLDILYELKGQKVFENSDFITKEMNSVIESWVSDWFSLRAKPDIQILLREIMYDMSSEVYKTLSTFLGKNIQSVIAKDPVAALFNEVAIGDLNLNNGRSLQLVPYKDSANEKEKMSNAGMGALILTGLDLIFTGGGASLLFTCFGGAAGGYFLGGARDDSNKIKEYALKSIMDKFNKEKSGLFKNISNVSADVLEKFDTAFISAVDLEIERVKSGLDQKKRDALLSKESKDELISNIMELNQNVALTAQKLEKFRKVD
jgi:small GTP-binding protein